MENLSLEQIDKIRQLVHSRNRDDIVLGVAMIYKFKPFPNWKVLTFNARNVLDWNVRNFNLMQHPDYGIAYNCNTYTQFFNKILNMQKGKTLYKKDSTGNIRYLKIWTDKDELVQESGVVGTDSPVEHRKTCKPKNVGKSNETTPEQQSKAEMKSKIAEKTKADYFTLEMLEKLAKDKGIL